MPTFIGSATAYATAGDLVNYHDARQIGDWCRDDGTRETNLANNGAVSAALLRASGEVELAVMVAQRYSLADLQAFPAGSPALQALVGLVCDIAYCFLAERRVPDVTKLSAWLRSQELLQRLREGERVFPLQDQTAAGGQMEEVDMTTQSDGLKHGLTDVASRYFGSRAESFLGN